MIARRHIAQLVLVAGATLALGVVAADDSKPAKPHSWKTDDLIEVEFSAKTDVTEHVSKPSKDEEETASTSSQLMKLTFIDRVDRVVGGRPVALSRHFTHAELLHGDEDAGPLGLAGRTVTLTRDAKGAVRAEWESGGDLAGQALAAALAAPWPDVDKEWRLDQGSRKGTLQRTPVESWKPAGAPPFVVDAVAEFAMPELRRGTWALTLEGDFKPAGKLEATVHLEGRETVDADDGSRTVDLSTVSKIQLTRRVTKLEDLPEDTAPKEDEDEAGEPDHEDDGEEPDDPNPEDDPEDDPEPEDDPKPEDDPEDDPEDEEEPDPEDDPEPEPEDDPTPEDEPEDEEEPDPEDDPEPEDEDEPEDDDEPDPDDPDPKPTPEDPTPPNPCPSDP